MSLVVLIRLIAFVTIFGGMVLWEQLAPARKPDPSKRKRWFLNLGLLGFNSLLLRLAFPLTAVGFASYCNAESIGLFNRISFPTPAAIALSAVYLDLVIYGQHVAFHLIPVFWRLHRVHHIDIDYDVTTGNRFHPIEILLSMVIKFAVIALIGAPAASVLIFEVLLNGSAMFNHGNVLLPERWERMFRSIIVTPSMHRIHHSIRMEETNSNYGFNLSIWDRFFRTYRKDPVESELTMPIGLETFREPRYQNFLQLLRVPFVNNPPDGTPSDSARTS